jgi:hypothetical protein
MFREYLQDLNQTDSTGYFLFEIKKKWKRAELDGSGVGRPGWQPSTREGEARVGWMGPLPSIEDEGRGSGHVDALPAATNSHGGVHPRAMTLPESSTSVAVGPA